MKVLQAYKIYLPDSYGGIPSVIELVASLPQASFQSFILVARRFGWGRRFILGGATVQAVGSLGTVLSMPLAVTYPFVFALLARSMDVVVCHAPFPLADIGILLGLPRRVPLIVHWHAEVIGRPVLSRFLAPLVRRVLERADRIVVSDPAIITHSPILQSHADKCVIVPYGCDSAYWAQLDEQQHSTVSAIKARSPRLVFAVGRLVSYKGYGALLKALREIDAQCVIVGEGPLRNSLEQMAAELGIADRVRFLGAIHRDRVKEYMHAACVIAFPSVTAAEAFGIVQIEAMSAGRPVVNTALPTAVPRVARDSKEGLTVPPDNAEALAAALGRLLDDAGLAERLGAAGQRRARAEFDSARFLARIEALYEEAANLRGSGG